MSETHEPPPQPTPSAANGTPLHVVAQLHRLELAIELRDLTTILDTKACRFFATDALSKTW